MSFCDNFGPRVLIHATNLARAAGANFLVVNPTRALLRLADILQASDLLDLPRPT